MGKLRHQSDDGKSNQWPVLMRKNLKQNANLHISAEKEMLKNHSIIKYTNYF